MASLRRLLRSLVATAPGGEIARMLVAHSRFTAAFCAWLVTGALIFGSTVEPAARASIDDLRWEAARLAEAGKWKEALAAGDKLLVACRREHGAEHAETAAADVFLGDVRWRLGEPVLAESHFRRALAVQEKVLPRRDPVFAATLSHLASSLKAQKRYAEATPLLQRTLELERELRGPNHEDTAVSARNVALLLRLQGEYERAVPLAVEALHIRAAALGHADPLTLASLRELVDIHERRGDFAAASECVAESVTALEKDGDSPALAAVLKEWGALSERQGRLAEAEPRYRRALAICEKALEPDDPQLASPLTALGACLRQLSRHDEASPLLERALALRLRSAAVPAADRALSYRELGWLRRMQGDHAAALPLFEKALATRESALGVNADDTIESLAELAGLHWLRGDFEKGERLLLSRRERVAKRFGAASDAAAEAWRDLATFYETAKRWPSAKTAARRCHTLLEKRLGPGDPRTLDALYFFARICAAAGDAKLAREQFARLQPWFDAHPEADARGRSEWMRQFAIATLRAGDAGAAEELFQQSLKWHAAKFGPSDPATLRSLGDLWTFYDESGQPERALDPARELAARSAQALGEDAPATLLVFERLAQLSAAQGQRADGAAWFRRAIDGARKRYGADAPETLAALGRLAAWHETADDFASAEPLRRERLAAIERAAGKESEAATAARGDLETCIQRRQAASR